MTSLLLSNPNLSSPFLPQTFSRRLQQKDTTSLYYNPLQKSSRCLTVVKCSIDSPYEGKTYGGGSSPWRRRLSSFQSSVHDSDFRVRKLSSRRVQQKDTTSLYYNPIQKSSRCLTVVKCSVDSPYEGNIPTFNRTSVWDPYKRLGVSQHASEEEVWSARNFLLDQYSGHERSEESVEGAFEKLLMTSFKQRKKTKINLKTRLKKQVDESPAWVKSLVSFVEIPPMDIIFRRLFLFAFMGAWSIMNSAEGGPAFQVAVSLAACIYFLNEKTKSLGRAFVIGLGALAAGWTCGAITVPMIPAVLINPNWTLELMTSLVAYCFLFLGCTFLK